MSYDVSRHGDSLQFHLRKNLEFEAHDWFRSILSTIGKERPNRCVFDLSDTDNVDSAGLGMLMIAYKKSQDENWRMSIRNPVPRVLRLLELSDMLKIIPVE